MPGKVARISGRLLALLVSLVALEVVCRFVLHMIFGTSMLYPEKVVNYFYPELEKAEHYTYQENKINVLALGGSVLLDRTVELEYQGKHVQTVYCDLKNYLPSERFNVLNLANSAHNTLDSRYKYSLLGNLDFDAVFIYHGINDTRANNIDRRNFDPYYRHIQFYDDLYVVMMHRELRYTAIPFLLHWYGHFFVSKRKDYIPKELFHGLLEGAPEPFLKEGSDIKTEVTFRDNIRSIVDLGAEREQKVILGTYAWYSPPDYSLEAFRAGTLDYDQQIWPTELYGIPENVEKGLDVHNRIIREISAQDGHADLIDFESLIPKSGEYFDDICHLNENGCTLMSLALSNYLMNYRKVP